MSSASRITSPPAALSIVPCNFGRAGSGKDKGAVADGIPTSLREAEPVGERGNPSVVPLNPDSRLGRLASPFLQGRDAMEKYVGVDVSKAALDVHVLPEGEALRVS